LTKLDDIVRRVFACFAYDQNNCWTEDIELDVDDIERAFLKREVSGRVVEIDKGFLDSCPPRLRAKLEALCPRVTHLHEHTDLGYPAHDCRELSLMLAGRKPLATFHMSSEQSLDEVTWRPQPWDRYVEEERIKRFEFSYTGVDGAIGRAVLFALPGEAWRFKAYEMLWRHSLEYGFSIYNEPLFGHLRGYSDEENRIFVEQAKRLRDAGFY